jgi:hypothetical protein
MVAVIRGMRAQIVPAREEQFRSPGRRGDVTSRKAAITPQRGSREGESPPFYICVRDVACDWMAKQRNSDVPPEPHE